MGSSAPGDILALHDGAEPHYPSRRDATARAIDPLVPALRGRGLEPVRFDQLLTGEPDAMRTLAGVDRH